MKRAVIVIAVLLALLLLAVLSLPLTAVGSRAVLALVERFAPVEMEYEGGSLVGGLRLASLRLQQEDFSLDVSRLALSLDPRCLPAAVLCLRELSLAELSMAWPGGHWSSSNVAGTARLSERRVDVSSLRADSAALTLRDSDGDEGQDTGLPALQVPLPIRVQSLELARLSLDLYDWRQEIEQASLAGEWAGQRLKIETLSLAAPALGEGSLSGDIRFRDDWPLRAQLDWRHEPQPELGRLMPRRSTVQAQGTLRQLAFDLLSEGQLSLRAEGRVAPLTPSVPLTARAVAEWSGPLPISQLPALAGTELELDLLAPLEVDLGGSLQQLDLSVQARGTGLGYEALSLQGRGQYAGNTLSLPELVLQAGADRVRLAGRVEDFGNPQWQLSAQTSGFDVPALAAPLSGRMAGEVEGQGYLRGDDWRVTLQRLALRGELGGLPASVEGRVNVASGALFGDADLRAQLGGGRIVFSDTRLSVEQSNLSAWSRDVAGALKFDAELLDGGERIVLEGAASDLRWEGLRLQSAALEARLDSRAQAIESLRLQADTLRWEQLQLQSVTLTGQGDSERQQLRLALLGDVAGELVLAGTRRGQGWQGELGATGLDTPLGHWRTEAPVSWTWQPDEALLRGQPHCWVQSQSRLCARGLELGATGSIDLTYDGSSEFADPFLPPGMNLETQMDLALRLDWSESDPLSASGRLRAPGGRVTRLMGEGDPAVADWQRLLLEFEYGDGLMELQADINAMGGGAALDLALPAQRTAPRRGKLRLRQLRLAALAPFTPELAELAGQLDGELRFSGSPEEPRVRGRIQLSDGRLRPTGNPTALQDLALSLDFRGTLGVIEGNGVLGGGPVALSGELRGGAEPSVEMFVEGERHQLLLPPSMSMVMSPALLVRASPGLVQVTGDVVVHDGRLEFESLPEGSVGLSRDVVIVDYRGEVVQSSRPFDTGLDIRLRLRDRFRVEGKLLSLFVGGDLQLLQEPGKPLQLFGNLQTAGGEIRALGQQLRIARGTIAFAGLPDRPQLDLAAERTVSGEDITVGLALRGPLQEAQLEVYSRPVMSQTEALSWLTRGRGLDADASADSSAMALSLGLSAVNRTGLLQGINSLPLVNRVSLGTDNTVDGTTATVSGYLGDRVYLSYGTGIYEPITVLTGRLYLQSRLWIEMVSALENSLDIYYSFDIE